MAQIKKSVRAARENGAKGGRPKINKIEKLEHERIQRELAYDRLQEQLSVIITCRVCCASMPTRYRDFHVGICCPVTN